MHKSKSFVSVVMVFFALAVLSILIYTLYEAQSIWSRHFNVVQMEPKLNLPIEFTLPLQSITVEDVHLFQELALLSLPEGNGLVLDITQDKEDKNFIVIYANGYLINWDLDTLQVSEKFTIGETSINGTNFSSDGSKVITPGSVTENNMNGVTVWDTDIGEQIYCYGKHCKSPTTGFHNKYLFLDPTGTFFVAIDGNSLIATPLEGDFVVSAHLYDCLHSDRSKASQISGFTIDTSNTYFAYVLENGIICIKELNGVFGIDLETSEEIMNSEEVKMIRYRLSSQRIDSKNLQIDPTNTWLGLLTDREVVTWNLQNRVMARKIKEPLSDGNKLRFDRSGKILVIGTDRKLIVYDTENGRQIISFEVGKVTALYFTRDNRLLVWGDAQGNVHLWGVPKVE